MGRAKRTFFMPGPKKTKGERYTIPCQYCGVDTSPKSIYCLSCSELRRRIRSQPEIAGRIMLHISDPEAYRKMYSR